MPSQRVLAAFLAIAAAAALFLVLMLDGAVAEAQSAPTPIQVAAGSVIVWETAIPEDWPQGQPSHIIMTLEAYSPDDAPLSFTLDDSPDAAKFSLIPAGMNEAGNYTAHLVLKEGEELDYETQDTYLIGVEVTTGAGDKTELLIRLLIIDVAEAAPSPEPTPTDPCFEVISGNVNIVRSWDSSCLSENRPNDAGAGDYYARFFTFTLSEAATVSINLNSDVDTYLYLLKGAEKAGEVIAESDDTVRYTDLDSTIDSQELEAGEYTIETTAYDTEMSGNFRLVVRGLPDTGEPAADCSTGGAVSGADENPNLVEDCETLLSLRDALAGAVLLNWAADTPITGWDGVTVGDSPMRVTDLALDDSGLSGELPVKLGDLDALRVLSLSDNSLKGAIPGELGNLAELKELALDGNRMTDSIPARLGALENLETLALNNNQLSGAIPAELGDLSELRSLSLADNRLSGAIPAELGDLSRLRSLSLADNRLTGEIPVELGELSNLAVLKLAGNSFSGCIPPALQDVADNDLADTGLKACASGVCATGAAVNDPNDNLGLVADCNALLAAHSRLAGGAPLNWSVDLPIEEWEGVNVGGSPKRVIHLVLTQETLTNRLTGRLSAELGKLSHLTLLQITGNEIDGAIPPELGRLSRLRFLVLADNELDGEIPPELDGLASLLHMNLFYNDLSGEIPPELSSLTNLISLYLNNNRLSGEVPGELASIPNLRSLSLHSNNFTGCIPKKLRNVPRNDLISLGLGFCEGQCDVGDAVPDPIEDFGLVSDCIVLLSVLDDLTGDASLNWSTELPFDQWEGVEIDDSLNRVTALNLSAKGLDGEIPPELANLTHLRVLSLSDNLLTGSIPSELGNPTRLEYLFLSDNDLSGAIPSELGGLTRLETLYLSNNRLSGEIPLELGSLSNLTHLYLSSNELSGEIPAEFAGLTNLVHLFLGGNQLTGCVATGLRNVAHNDLSLLDLSDCEVDN